jgi:hypothetical protein
LKRENDRRLPKGIAVSRRLRRLACCAGIAVVALVAAPSSGAPASSRVTFATFHEPGAGRDGGEPTIGASWRTGNVMFQSSLRSLRVTFNGTSSTWTESSAPTARNVSLDPMLYTDPVTGRTFVSQLLANCSSLAYTDNDGLTWSPGMGCGLGVAVDHQSIGGGPFPAGIKPTGTYPHAVYYCAQALVDASCARSDDGGLTFGPEYPMYLLTDCGGLHGMPRVAPDGTVYVPNSDCGGAQGVVVSSDGGRTWAISTIDGSKSPGESDPAVAIGSRGTAYVGWQNGDTNETHPYVAVSKNAGRSWSRPVDVGKAFGIKNVQFPAMVAGDDGRAAFAFLGSTTDGDDQAAAYTGTWHVYVATTYDAGAHWTTVDATPKELAQRGCIWMAGAENECRNLLDFMGMTVDKQGRVLVGWADGCSGVCEHGGANTFTATATISRQSGGRGLFAAYDGRW